MHYEINVNMNDVWLDKKGNFAILFWSFMKRTLAVVLPLTPTYLSAFSKMPQSVPSLWRDLLTTIWTHFTMASMNAQTHLRKEVFGSIALRKTWQWPNTPGSACLGRPSKNKNPSADASDSHPLGGGCPSGEGPRESWWRAFSFWRTHESAAPPLFPSRRVGMPISGCPHSASSLISGMWADLF